MLEPVMVPTREPVIVPVLEPVIVPVREPVIVPTLDCVIPVLDPVMVPALDTVIKASTSTPAVTIFRSCVIFDSPCKLNVLGPCGDRRSYPEVFALPLNC